MRDWIIKHDKEVQRALEILPGFVSWNVILFPWWGILVIPTAVAYFILFFNIYWFFQSFQTAVSATFAHLRVQASMNYDWLGDLKPFADWKRIQHVIIMPTYKEPLYILLRSIQSIADQDLPKKQIHIILAMEENEDIEERQKKVEAIQHKFDGVFKKIFVTVHKLSDREIAGKSSNERYAALWFKKNYIEKNKLDLNYFVVTSSDADHKYHPRHFSCLTYKFLDDSSRYKKFWQAAVLFYNNIWDIPAVTRVPNTMGSMWNLSQLPRRDKLINAQNYSLSFRLLDSAGYWDPDKIPEDWGIFFKAFFKMKGGIEVEPIYLPIYADAAQSTGFWKTIKNQFEQYKRWAYGVSDDPWIIKNYLTVEGIPFWDKTTRLMWALWAHFSWPIHWFLITLGITLPSLLNPAFARTALGYTVPKLSSLILTVCLLFLLSTLIIDASYKPRDGKNYSRLKLILSPFEFILMPISGFLLSALPGLDAHTRLMLRRYLGYRVTEKV